ncbi:MAG: NADPH-dependent 7-cyano-7-deazaguanine reductase QueF, partial [Rickettsiales bacterium]|nr:NADPH-dependent 7-cyano-7-deazaguanine reductase QueF [Rickettsiales bacterium]
GGIPIDVFFQQGKLPEDVFVREQKVKSYKGRG